MPRALWTHKEKEKGIKFGGKELKYKWEKDTEKQ